MIQYNQKKHEQNDAYWAILAQFISVVLTPFFAWFFYGKLVAASIGLGGGICLIPNFCLYRCVFKYSGARQAKQMVRAFYLGEVLKISLTILLFGFVLSCISWVLAYYVFIGYIFTQIVFWAAPLLWGIIKTS